MIIEQAFVSERGRKRRRPVRVDLDEVRRRLGQPADADHAAWTQVRSLLLQSVGDSTFAIWLEPLELIAIDASGALVVAAPTETVSWVRKRFGRLIAGCAERAGRQLRLADEPERLALGRNGCCAQDARALFDQSQGGSRMILTISNQKGGVGKTTTAANVGVLLARQGERVLVVDTDPQFALTRQRGLEVSSLGVSLVDVLAGRALAADAIVAGVLGRERFLRDSLATVIEDYEQVVIDIPPNLGLLTVNALVCAEVVLAPVSAEDEASLHGILELRTTLRRLTERLGVPAPESPRSSAPAGRIPSRSARIARAAASRIPLARSEPDSSPALDYRNLADLLAGVNAR